jgi:hypothetical protein
MIFRGDGYAFRSDLHMSFINSVHVPMSSITSTSAGKKTEISRYSANLAPSKLVGGLPPNNALIK